jgi:hypothetical protein
MDHVITSVMRRSSSMSRACKRRRSSSTVIAIRSSGLVVLAAVAAATDVWAVMTRVVQRCQARRAGPAALSGRRFANHLVLVRTSHRPGRDPESVPDRAVKESDMTLDNEQIVRQAYKIAEDRDLEGWVAAFTDRRRAFHHPVPAHTPGS